MARALLAACVAALCAATLASPAGAGPPTYRPPVDAPVHDPFRAPATRFGPGNRGLEYATAPGTPVAVVADGRVTFAGLVAGARHVTVLHPDGVRTTYSFLATIEVVVGQHLRQGDRVGTTVARLHLGARRGDAYFDPASLFALDEPRVRLVPFDDPPGSGPTGERRAIGQLVAGVGGLVADLGRGAGAVGGWLRAGADQRLAALAAATGRFGHPAAMLDLARTTWTAWQRARQAADRPCSPASVQPRPLEARRVVVLVAGLGSHSRGSTVDEVRTAALGYDAADVLRFSYAGGRVPDRTDGFRSIPSRAYGAAATQTDLRATAARLADLVEAVVAEAPGVPVDLIAHSQGGVVTRLALIELERRHGATWLGRFGMVATLGSPHGGADLATAVHGLSSTATGDVALDGLGAATNQVLDDDAPAIAQLSEASDVVAELAGHPVPAGVVGVSISARGDVIVPVPRTVAPGMTEVVVPLMGGSAHGALPGSEEATRALGLALAGLPPGCQTLADALTDQAVGEGISLTEDLVGALGVVAALGADVRVGAAAH